MTEKLLNFHTVSKSLAQFLSRLKITFVFIFSVSDSAVSDSKMSMVAVMPPKNFVTQMYTEDEELGGGGIGGSNNYQLLKRVSQLLDSASMRTHEHQDSSYLEEVFIVCLTITFSSFSLF